MNGTFFSIFRLHFKSAIGRLFLSLIALVAANHPSIAQKRYAFVVGIDRYPNLLPQAQLKKAVGDANAMAETLRTLNFEVTQVIEPTRGEFIAKWFQFLERVKLGDTIGRKFVQQ